MHYIFKSSPMVRPEFSQILEKLEQFAPSEEAKHFSIGPLFNEEATTTSINEESETGKLDNPFFMGDNGSQIRHR